MRRFVRTLFIFLAALECFDVFPLWMIFMCRKKNDLKDVILKINQCFLYVYGNGATCLYTLFYKIFAKLHFQDLIKTYSSL